MRSFLHTVQKNQMLMMTPNTLGRTSVVKSFIKHTTPLKLDPKVSYLLMLTQCHKNVINVIVQPDCPHSLEIQRLLFLVATDGLKHQLTEEKVTPQMWFCIVSLVLLDQIGYIL